MASVKKAAESGDRLKALINLRDLLAERLDNSKSDRDIAALSRQFVQVTAEIDRIKGENKEKVRSLTDMRKKLKVAK